MLCNVDSGNIVLLLSMLTGADENEIESLLFTGLTPWAVASKYGKYEEFKELIKENYAQSLNALVENNELSPAAANEMYNKISLY